VVVLRRDPLADPQPIPWPQVQAGRCSLWEAIPVGEDEDGNQVTVTLPERNLLAGGEPGAGKSTVVQLLIAAAALDPGVVLTLFDPKLVELAVWQGCTRRLVGPNVEEAIDVLKGLISELDFQLHTRLLAGGETIRLDCSAAPSSTNDLGEGIRQTPLGTCHVDGPSAVSGSAGQKSEATDFPATPPQAL
jgi:FtsK/SpoIIIE family